MEQKKLIRRKSQIHRKLFEDLEKDMSVAEVKEFKTHSRAYGLRAGQVDRMNSMRDVLEGLEKRGEIRVGEYGNLKSIIADMDATHLLDTVQQAEEEIQLIDQVASPEAYTSPTERKNFEFAAVRQDGASTEDEHSVYPVKSNKTLFVVINNFTMERSGNEKDRADLEKLFKEKLKYEFYLFENCSEVNFKNNLEEVRRTLDGLVPYDRFFLTIMSHGDKDGIKTCHADGKREEEGKRITVKEILSNFDCKALRKMEGQPKVFIIQACRGGEAKEGVERQDEGPEDVDDATGHMTTPVDADMLVSFSTTKGFTSTRNTVQGAWFIQDLVRVLEENYQTTHLLDMLTKVNSRVADRMKSDGTKDMPMQSSTLRKKIYLHR